MTILKAGLSYYNLGIGAEWDVFPRKLMERNDLRPKAVIINAYYFFYNSLSLAGKEVLTQKDDAIPLKDA